MTLSPRFVFSDVPALRLTAQQRVARDTVATNLTGGTYTLEDVDCVCGTAGGLVIAERDRYGLPVRTVLCEQCGLLRTSPRMDQASTERFYGELYRDLYTGDHDREGLYQRQQGIGRGLHRLLARLIPDGGSVFEVGCGPGGILKPFADAGYQVAGADLGADYLSLGRADGLDLIEGDADALRESHGQADLVILNHVLEHFLDLPGELAKIRELIRPGGCLFVEVPGVLQLGRGYRGNLMLYLQNAHTYHFTGPTLKYALELAGFDVQYADDLSLAVALRPQEGLTSPTAPPAGEAGRVLHYLGELEKKFLQATGT